MKKTANILEYKVGINAIIDNFVCMWKCRLGYMNINERVHTGNSFVAVAIGVSVGVVPCEQPLKYQFSVIALCVHHPSCVALTMRGNPSSISFPYLEGQPSGVHFSPVHFKQSSQSRCVNLINFLCPQLVVGFNVCALKALVNKSADLKG